jgi:hypothetical protein
LLEAAAAAEPSMTALVVAGADALDLELYGLEHRLKTRPSLERKIQTAMSTEGLSAEDVVISDTLRYTVLLHDEPPGSYDATVAGLLSRAEVAGFEVVEVKNYWPEGDTYSGVNAVLVTCDGLLWEVQFHTVGSLAARLEGHELYEIFRLPTTRLAEKRRIFDVLRARWQWVQVPDGVLVPGSLHETESVILRERP